MKLVLLLALVSAVAGLTPGEVEGLQSMLIAWPRLRFQTPPWTVIVSAACRPPGFYGVTCSNDGESIIGLYVGLISMSFYILSTSSLNLTHFALLPLNSALYWVNSSFNASDLRGSIPEGISSLASLETLYALSQPLVRLMLPSSGIYEV